MGRGARCGTREIGLLKAPIGFDGSAHCPKTDDLRFS